VIYNISIIGAGQLGSRHLQGLAKSSKQFQIYVVDSNEKALSVAAQRFKEVSKYTKSFISYHQNISDLPKKIDLVIIATTANVRRVVVENLLGQSLVRFLILEKVVFQRSEDFRLIQKLLLDNGVKSWVNCARRSYPFYKNLKNELVGEKLSIKVKGNNWGLACNSIHMIDLLAFLTEQTDFDFDTGGLENIVINSKRNGYKELKGRLKITTKHGNTLELIDNDKYNNDFEISISNKDVKYKIFEGKGFAIEHLPIVGTREKKIQFLLQSELTGIMVDQILDTDESDLTSYDECMKYHISMLNAFNYHISKVTGKTVTICPIT
jgi:hypothetical protein